MNSIGRRYTERLAEAGAVTSVGSKGDSYDNAMAESVIGLYKTELVRRKGPWRFIFPNYCFVWCSRASPTLPSLH